MFLSALCISNLAAVHAHHCLWIGVQGSWTVDAYFSVSVSQVSMKGGEHVCISLFATNYLRRGTAPRCLGCCCPVWGRSRLSCCPRTVFSESDHRAKSKQPRFANSWPFLDQALSRSLKISDILWQHFSIHVPLVPCVAAMPAMVARSPKRGAPIMIPIAMAPVIILILLSLNRNVISFVFPFTNSDDAICIKCRKELSFRDSSEVLNFTCYREELQLLLSSTSAHSGVLACSSDSLPKGILVF